MNRKLLLMTMVIVALSFMASGAMAQQIPSSWTASSVAAFTTHNRGPFGTFGPNSGTTAGTIVGSGTATGDALIFPYYDVRAISVLGANQEQDFYFCVINETVNPTTFGTDTTWGGVAAKLRFREFDKSLEVYDVDIWLSCNDVWCGTLVNNNGIPRITSGDYVITGPSAATACTTDDFVLDNTTLAAGRDFRVALQNIDPARSLYGYFELIGTEMTACGTHTETEQAGTLVSRWCPGGPPCEFLDAPNTLAGYAYIVRPTDGVAMGYNATNIDNFSRHSRGLPPSVNPYLADRSGCGFSLFAGAGSERPDLTDCEDTLDQLEFEMSKFLISGGFAIETGYVGRTSTVVTFPTKHFHFASSSPFTLRSNSGVYGVGDFPWGSPFAGATSNTGELVGVRVWDRSEHEFSIPGGFESPPPPTISNGLPWEVNVIGWYTGSSSPTLVGRDNVGFPVGDSVFSGWFLLEFDQVRDLSVGTPSPIGNNKLFDFDYFGNLFRAYKGLPALALIIQQFNNLNLTAGGAYGEILPAFSRPDWEKPDGRAENTLPIP
jgi:hypothetical protein